MDTRVQTKKALTFLSFRELRKRLILFELNGAEEGIRTHTPFRVLPPQGYLKINDNYLFVNKILQEQLLCIFQILHSFLTITRRCVRFC
jgi:hypothetical protein